MNIDSAPNIRLRVARKAAGFCTSSAFCKQYNIPASTYSQHETGKRALKDDALSEYAKYLGLSLIWLKFGRERPFKDEKLNALVAEKLILEKNESPATDSLYELGFDHKLLALILNSLFDMLEARSKRLTNEEISKAAGVLYLSLQNASAYEQGIQGEVVRAAVKTYLLASEQ
ncbi:MAG: helix-turn-helix transcriptional regulator [Legionellales bacterium]|nr:helix-turn-helix transcriptional regulator [Legionellales bacterium]